MPNLFLLNYKQKASGFCPLKAFCKLKGVWSGWEGIIEVTEPIPSCVAEISQCLQHGEGWLGKHRQGKAAILGSFYNRGQCLRGINTLTPPPTPPRQLQLNYRKSKPPLLPLFCATRVRRHAPRTSTGTHTNTHGRKTERREAKPIHLLSSREASAVRDADLAHPFELSRLSEKYWLQRASPFNNTLFNCSGFD